MAIERPIGLVALVCAAGLFGTAHAEDLAQPALYFEANQGQASSDVAFVGRAPLYSVAVMRSGEVRLHPRAKGGRPLAIRPLGGRPGSIESRGQAPGRTNYFLGDDPRRWLRDVRHHEAVAVEGVWPSVDLVAYGNEQDFEFDLEVEPGADPEQVRLAYAGASRLETAADGSLLVTLGKGTLRQEPPVVYQGEGADRVAVPARYRLLAKNVVGFEVDAFDPTKTLVIDPVLNFSTYLGGTGLDTIHDIARDGSGNLYVTGTTGSSDFPTAASLIGSLATAPDAYMAKISPDGRNLLQLTYFGGNGADAAWGIALDSGGNVFLAGESASSDLPLITSVQPYQGGVDGFIVRLDTLGVPDFATYYGGTLTDRIFDIALASNDEIFVVGQTNSTVAGGFPLSAGGLAKGGGNEAFVARLSLGPAAIIHSTYFGGGGSADLGRAIHIDESGGPFTPTAWIAGETNSAALAGMPGLGFDQSANGGTDAFVAALIPDVLGTSVLYSSFLGGAGTDRARSVAVNAAGGVFVVGEAGAGFPTAGAAFDTTFGTGTSDGFLTVLGSGSSLAYSTYLGGSGVDVAFDVAATGSLAWVAGRTTSADFPTSTNPVLCDGSSSPNPASSAALQRTAGGAQDATLTLIDVGAATGPLSLTYSTRIGGTSNDQANALVVAPDGTVYLAGQTASANFPTNVQGSGDPLQIPDPGSTDGFVSRIDPANPLFTVVAPADSAGGKRASFGKGTTQQIRWGHNVGKYSFVRLEYSTAGPTGPWTNIAASVDLRTNAINTLFTSARYNWLVPTGVATSSTAHVRVLWNANNTVCAVSDDFDIQPVSFSFTQPKAGPVADPTNVLVDWQSNAGLSTVSLGITADTSLTNKSCTWLTDVPASTPSISLDLSAFASGSYQICIRHPATGGSDWTSAAGGQTTGISPIIALP